MKNMISQLISSKAQNFRESCIKNKNCPVGYFFMVMTLSRELLIQSTSG
jgi:hypothetical protein